MKKVNRRDFLKLTGAVSASWALQRWLPGLNPGDSVTDHSSPNIIVLVFDAMSASHLSLYGYPRNTTPNIERFAERATVYHSHYSTGNFTVPGTASLLTGMYPWRHRAINQAGLIAREHETHNIFNQFGTGYHRLAFSQNVWADFFLNQFEKDIEKHLFLGSYAETASFKGEYFPKDRNPAYRALDDSVVTIFESPTSLVFGVLNRLMFIHNLNKAQGSDYPRGLPGLIGYPLYFRLEPVFDGVISECKNLTGPALAYFHIFPPHEPYRPRADFSELFDDSFLPVPKPAHPLDGQFSQETLDTLSRQYDQMIAHVDSEFGRLIDALEEAGLIENSYVFITSDHGQLFERGVHGHSTPLMYEPLIRIPLLISSPGQAIRRDVYTPTSSVDILPTVLQKSGMEIPAWCEGRPLPEGGDSPYSPLPVFSLDAKINSAFAPLTHCTVSIRKGQFKLIHYLGYQEFYRGFEDTFEMYDMESDPEELSDLFKEKPGEFFPMKEELLDKLSDVNRSYR